MASRTIAAFGRKIEVNLTAAAKYLAPVVARLLIAAIYGLRWADLMKNFGCIWRTLILLFAPNWLGGGQSLSPRQRSIIMLARRVAALLPAITQGATRYG